MLFVVVVVGCVRKLGPERRVQLNKRSRWKVDEHLQSHGYHHTNTGSHGVLVRLGGGGTILQQSICTTAPPTNHHRRSTSREKPVSGDQCNNHKHPHRQRTLHRRIGRRTRTPPPHATPHHTPHHTPSQHNPPEYNVSAQRQHSQTNTLSTTTIHIHECNQMINFLLGPLGLTVTRFDLMYRII